MLKIADDDRVKMCLFKALKAKLPKTSIPTGGNSSGLFESKAASLCLAEPSV